MDQLDIALFEFNTVLVYRPIAILYLQTYLKKLFLDFETSYYFVMKIFTLFSLIPEPNLDPYIPPTSQTVSKLIYNGLFIGIRLILIGIAIAVAFIITVLNQVFNKDNKLVHTMVIECGLRNTARFILFLFGISKINFKNIKGSIDNHLKLTQNHLTISNHPCPLDGPLMFSQLGRTSMGSTKTCDLWLIGYIFKALKAVQVDRYNKSSKHKLLKNIITGDVSLKDHHLFVEGKLGSVVNGKQYILQWASGAFCSNMPVAAYFVSFSNKEKLKYINFRKLTQFFSFINTRTNVTIEFIGEYHPPKIIKQKICKVRKYKSKFIKENDYDGEFKSLLNDVEKWKNGIKNEYAKKSNSILSKKDRFDMIIINTGECKNGNIIFNKYVTLRNLQKVFGKINFLEYLELIKTLRKIIENNKPVVLKNVEFCLEDVFIKYKNKNYRIKEFSCEKRSDNCMIKVVDNRKKIMYFDAWVVILLYLGIKHNALKQCKRENIKYMIREINKY